MMSHEQIGVVGLGLLGRGIAACFLRQGFDVIGLTPTDAEHIAARSEIAKLMAPIDDWELRFDAVTDFAKLKHCTFVIESVPEDLPTKLAVLDALENVLAPDIVIASNTSAIPISVLQQSRKHPQRMVGMHWAEPAHATRFLELIRGDLTSDEAFEATLAMGRRLGKEPIACQKDIPGFIVNRIGYAMYREACHLIELGVADADSIDRSLRNSLGLWASICGPFRWIDITGGPALYARAMERVLPTLSNTATIPKVLAELAQSGASGITNGHGFYRYTAHEAQEWQDRYHRHVIEVGEMQDREFPLEE
jgi:3-hydroxybutyryl-CoA dehydrogenase